MTDEDVTMGSDNASAKEYGDKNEFVRSKLDHKVIQDNTIQHNLRRLLLGVVDSWNEWDDAWHPGTDRVILISESALIAKHHIKLLELFKQSHRTSQFEPLITFYKSLTQQSESFMLPIHTGGALPVNTCEELSDLTPVEMLSASFKTGYRGPGVAALLQHLIKSEKNFVSNTPRRYYARFFSFIQASGTGKTKTIMQLSKRGILVMYICLRDETDLHNFPARDRWPADTLLKGFPRDGIAYLVRCYLFFAALFQALESELAPMKHLGMDELAVWFDQEFGVYAGKKREEFFSLVEKKYNDQNVTESLKLGSSDTPTQAHHITTCQAKMRDSYQSLMLTIFGTSGSSKPKLVIAVDEAQAMSAQQEGYKPSYYLCHALSDLVERDSLRGYPVWTIFASTTPKLSRFAAESAIHDSQRVSVKGQLIVTPFTITGYDQLATAKPKIDPISVGSLAQLKGFGRPLWGSFSDEKWDEILPLARLKIIHSESLDEKDLTDQALAVLSQRFALNVAFGHPESVKFIDTSISSFMRICISITDDRMWRFTSYPSEPILSSAAATVMHGGGGTNIVRCLQVLNQKIRSGMINRGARGELVCRLLLLLGRDYTPEAPIITSTSIPTVPYCRPVRLLDYLVTTFGFQRDFDQDVRNAFDDAYINFSHWVSLKDNIQPSKGESSPFDHTEYLYRHWIRGSAVQFSHNQPLANQAAVIYFHRLSKAPRDRTSSMVVSVKPKVTPNEPDSNPLYPKNKPTGLDSTLPCVVVLCGTGLTSEPATWSFEDECLRIYTSGVSRMSFPFLARVEGLENEMIKLTKDAQRPIRQDAIELGTRAFEIGRSSLASDLKWENFNVDVANEELEAEEEME